MEAGGLEYTLRVLFATKRKNAQLAAHVQAASDAALRPVDGGRYLVKGESPLTVTFVGGGLAVGYGAIDRRSAIDGRVGEGVAARLGRGVTILNNARHAAKLADQVVDAAITLGFKLTDVVVWCPSYVEMASSSSSSAWRTSLDRLLSLTSVSLTYVLLIELPMPVGDHPLAKHSAKRILEINEAIRQVASAHKRVSVVKVPNLLIRPSGESLFSEEYYNDAARPIVDKIVAYALDGRSA